jgi:hypothetical protein
MSAVTVEDSERRWTPLAMKRALSAAGRWPEVKTMLVAADKYDDFLMCSYIYEGDEDFQDAKAWAVEHYGEESVNALLDAIPTEG